MKVLVVDDHAIVRHGLKQILSELDEITLVAEAATGNDAIRMVRDAAWDLVMLDITLPDRNGIEVLKQLKNEFPKLRVLMLTGHGENQYALRALKAGAAGYLTKQSAADELITAVRQVASGRKYVTASLAEMLAENLGHDVERPRHETLSDREYQTLCLIAQGKSLTLIAEEMCLSVKTVSVYRSRLLQKMELKNNPELIHYAIKNGLVEPM